jgi:hypothetical protein
MPRLRCRTCAAAARHALEARDDFPMRIAQRWPGSNGLTSTAI